jgi:DNA sulfur modification protein DndC
MSPGETIRMIRAEYERARVGWCVGFSGGKDSSALLKLVFLAVERSRARHVPIHVIYCDTGVEIPIVSNLVSATLRDIRREALGANLPIDIHVAEPPTPERFFVKVIGRGYPPPTNKFRWCTDRLRISPVQRVIHNFGSQGSIVLLGIRRGESEQRDRTIAKWKTKRTHFLRQQNGTGTRIFAPILDYGAKDVWLILRSLPRPYSINGNKLALLYREAGGECPIIRDPRGTPCGTGRFGCWTCTVVRQDRAVTNLVSEGHDRLRPLLGFRNWLSLIRDNPAYRCRFRRNGENGPGPFRLDARHRILECLFMAQKASGFELIRGAEVELIQELWDVDQKDPSYRQIE